MARAATSFSATAAGRDSLGTEVLVGIAPVTLGGGAPLLPRRLTAAELELVDVVRDKQFARLSYRLRR
jgi:hypothetical protein